MLEPIYSLFEPVSETIEQYFDLFDSFQKFKFSDKIDTVSNKIVSILESPQINSRIKAYLVNRDTKGGLPFTNFAEDPDSISQIKKLLNALHHARLALKDLEALNIRDKAKLVAGLRSNFQMANRVIDHVYQASYLITHLDVDLRAIFADEEKMLGGLLDKFNTFSQNTSKNFLKRYSTETAQLNKSLEELKSQPLSYTAGMISGIAIDQMQPSNNDLDYTFLTQFSAVLPGYIEKFRQDVSKYSSEIINKESTLNQERLLELQNAAAKLLSDLQSVKSSGVFLPLKFLNYIHIVSNVITLSMSTLEQAGHLSDSSQDVIRDKLRLLKYNVLPTLFGLADKVEDNLLLAPGTLSNPMMNSIKPLYQLLVELASSPVDFNAKGEELLSIEDSRFVALRLEHSHKRVDEAKRAIFKIGKAQKAFNAFFDLLENPDFSDLALQNLPEEDKQEIANHYKLLKPYLAQFNIELSDTIIDSLNYKGTVMGGLAKALRLLTLQNPPDKVSIILAAKAELQQLINKDRATREFHITLNEDLISSVNNNTDLALFPNTRANVFIVNERRALKVKKKDTIDNSFVKAPNGSTLLDTNNADTLAALTSQQALDLHLWYENKLDKFEDAYDAYKQFIRLLEHPEEGPKHSNTILELSELDELQGILVVASTELHSPDKAKRIAALISTMDELKKTRQGQRSLNGTVHFNELIEYAELMKKSSTNDVGKTARLTEFIDLLHKVSLESLETNKVFTLRDMETLLKKAKADKEKAPYRALYNQFQNYFVSTQIDYLDVSTVEEDKYISHFLAGKSDDSDNAVLDIFKNRDLQFQQFFTQQDLTWKKRSRFFEELADEKYDRENETLPLQKDAALSARAHYVVKTNLSKPINAFKKDLLELTKFMNSAMQKELQFNTSGLPFPALNNAKTISTQCEQVLALKRIFNSLHHIEGVAYELEQLNNKSYQTIYVKHLFQAYGHLYELEKLTMGLIKDPHFGVIAKELYNKAQGLIATFQDHTEEYRLSPGKVDDEVIEYNSLWYVLNAFYLAPKHIRTLRNNGYTTAEEFEELHRDAKLTTQRIEAIMNSSHSYFKLFLQTPKMYLLYRDLTNKLNEFTSTTHDAVMNNLDHIKSSIITPMLLEADAWEDKLGLQPGFITTPLKNITDEYFKGLLSPLGLPSRVHLDLVLDNSSLVERKKLATSKLVEANRSTVKFATKEHYLINLRHLIESYQSDDNLLTKNELIQEFKSSLPRLVKLQKKVTVDSTDTKSSIALDKFLNDATNEYDPKFKNILNLVNAGIHYYESKIATSRMSSLTYQEKLTHLEEQTKQTVKADELFIEQYTEAALMKRLKNHAKKSNGLVDMQYDYQKELKSYVLGFKKAIIDEAKDAEEINDKVNQLVDEKIALFENNNFVQYFHLDTIKIALKPFKVYFTKAQHAIDTDEHCFENELTLKKKQELITHIYDIANNKELSIQVRLDTLKAEIDNDQFRETILAYEQPDVLSFAFLQQCIFALLEALYLYTPHRKAIVENLSAASNIQPSQTDLIKRFGLFNTPTEQAKKGYEPPEFPQDLGSTTPSKT